MSRDAVHPTDKPLVTAEAFTHRPDRNPRCIDPYAMKAVGDQACCVGLNHSILTESALQVWRDRVKPGMTFDGWGTPFNPNQTWWEPGRAWMAYQARCHAVLQKGRPVADILTLAPFVPGQSCRAPPRGIDAVRRQYNYDPSAEEVFVKHARCANGRIVLPGMQYCVLTLVNGDGLRPRTPARIAELVEQGDHDRGSAFSKRHARARTLPVISNPTEYLDSWERKLGASTAYEEASDVSRNLQGRIVALSLELMQRAVLNIKAGAKAPKGKAAPWRREFDGVVAMKDGFGHSVKGKCRNDACPSRSGEKEVSVTAGVPAGFTGMLDAQFKSGGKQQREANVSVDGKYLATPKEYDGNGIWIKTRLAKNDAKAGSATISGRGLLGGSNVTLSQIALVPRITTGGIQGSQGYGD